MSANSFSRLSGNVRSAQYETGACGVSSVDKRRSVQLSTCSPSTASRRSHGQGKHQWHRLSRGVVSCIKVEPLSQHPSLSFSRICQPSSNPPLPDPKMSLDTQGIISAVTLAIYVPILVLTLRICSKYGIRERGWLLLVIFSLSESRRQVLIYLLTTSSPDRWWCIISCRRASCSSRDWTVYRRLRPRGFRVIAFVTQYPRTVRNHVSPFRNIAPFSGRLTFC